MATFTPYLGNKYSQNGEDGIVAELISRIGIKEPGNSVEFGAGDGRELSNTLRLTERGWRSVLIEQNKTSASTCEKLAAEFMPGQVIVKFGTVGFGPDDNLDTFLADTGFQKDLDVLSIDVDSYDLQIWRATTYQAKIVIIEINSGIPLGTYQEHGDGKQGASFTSMVELAKQKGYVLVFHTGNLIFVDEKYKNLLKMTDVELTDPDVLFNDQWVRWSR